MKWNAIGQYGNATPDDVLQGRRFTSLAGPRDEAGNISKYSSLNISPGTSDTAIPTGYHDGSGTVAGDSNLKSSNIRSGYSIFGVSGSVDEEAKITDSDASGDLARTYVPSDRVSSVSMSSPGILAGSIGGTGAGHGSGWTFGETEVTFYMDGVNLGTFTLYGTGQVATKAVGSGTRTVVASTTFDQTFFWCAAFGAVTE